MLTNIYSGGILWLDKEKDLSNHTNGVTAPLSGQVFIHTYKFNQKVRI